jgi:hypothetical protein
VSNKTRNPGGAAVCETAPSRRHTA